MSRSVLGTTDFGKEIRKRLIDLDMDTKDLAEKMHYSPSYVGEILRGTRKAERVRREICEAVGLDYDELMQRIEKGV